MIDALKFYAKVFCGPYYTLSFTIVNTTPLLKDLYQHITPQYAADWKVIGTLLGLPNGELNAIEAGYATNVKWCCNQMLQKWLEMDTTASWGKLLTVIESPAVSCTQFYSSPDKGKIPLYVHAYMCVHVCVCVCVCAMYIFYVCMHVYIYVRDGLIPVSVSVFVLIPIIIVSIDISNLM